MLLTIFILYVTPAVLMYIDHYVTCSRHHRVAMASNFVNGNKPSAIPCKYKLCSIQMFIFNDKKFNSCFFHIVSALFWLDSGKVISWQSVIQCLTFGNKPDNC